MRAVLGIDAAWTLSNPSGVALVAERSGHWRLIKAVPSYDAFHALAGRCRPAASAPDAAELLSSASAICGHRVDLVAIDMPLARMPIVGRRVSDDAVSRAYGGRKCGTHTPSARRPGRISDELRKAFELSGYPLLTSAVKTAGVIEVYPHAALVELASSLARLPYKVSKIRSYWPSLTPFERRERLYQQWIEIITLLEGRIAGVAHAMPIPETGARGVELKSYEDILDAIVCAWVGICVLEGRAKAFGDENSAIWIPNGSEAPRLVATGSQNALAS